MSKQQVFIKFLIFIYFFLFTFYANSQNTIEGIPDKQYIDIKNYSGWRMSSLPMYQPDLFPESELVDSIGFGFNRAKLAWYTIDPLFLRNNSATPTHIKNNPDLQSSHFVREIYETEIYPERANEWMPSYLRVLNLAFYPKEKGSYNYDVFPTSFSAGIDTLGQLQEPNKRWGGIARSMKYTNLEKENIKNLEFWLMDPFVYDSIHSGGELYFNLGDVSEDILKDSMQFYESGMSKFMSGNKDTTIWGIVPISIPSTDAFSTIESDREHQDVGYDGLRTDQEETFFKNYLDQLFNKLYTNLEANYKASKDPSNDNYHYFKGSDYDDQELGILDRYKFYNNPDGNSPTAYQSTESYQTTGTITPDTEDYNRDTIFNQEENYFQYLVHIKPDSFKIGHNFLDDTTSYLKTLANGEISRVMWFHFTIPLDSVQRKLGDINDFTNIKFVRMFLRGFEKPIILRFAKLDLTSHLDERYIVPEPIKENKTYIYPNPNNGTFRVYNDGLGGFRNISNFELYNMQGHKLELDYVKDTGVDLYTIKLKHIELKNLKNGVYFLHFEYQAAPYHGVKKILILNE